MPLLTEAFYVLPLVAQQSPHPSSSGVVLPSVFSSASPAVPSSRAFYYGAFRTVSCISGVRETRLLPEVSQHALSHARVDPSLSLFGAPPLHLVPLLHRSGGFFRCMLSIHGLLKWWSVM